MVAFPRRDPGLGQAEKDLISILDYQVGRESVEVTRASETHSLQPGTSAWSRFGTIPLEIDDEGDTL
ncbi:hypothetical protein [Streptomyces sp. NPDC058613]|uniref:hypothetical protein n=1 Tax=unclassified Streptomyces TaxID=2593676 RepID=UPI00365D69BF